MTSRWIPVACLLFTINIAAQEGANANKPAGAPVAENYAAEARSRKIWADFKDRNKTALAATLADGFRALEEGADFTDAKGYLSGLDDFQLRSYDLTDYRAIPLGRDSILINYHARYEGISGGETSQGNAGFSEVWVRRDGSWKIQYLQETYVK
jgi:Domain of unknown function (DUF4440)